MAFLLFLKNSFDILVFLYIIYVDTAVACLGCGNLFDTRLCKDDNFARFLVWDWKAAKYAINI